MSPVSEKLLQKRVTRFEHVHDYTQIYFHDGSVLNIFNAFTIKNGNPATLIEKSVAEVHSDLKSIKIIFSHQDEIRVGMEESDFNGPEAMELIEADNSRFVWP